MSRCAHDGSVEVLDLPRMSSNGPPPRKLWQCSACGMTWKDDPRQIAAAVDGLGDALRDSILAGADACDHEHLTVAQRPFGLVRYCANCGHETPL